MLLFAHRGVHDRDVNENTIKAFRCAVELGVDGVEFDLRVSRDDVPVVVHDDKLDRIAGDGRRVSELTAAELGALTLRGAGHIPELNDVTATVPTPLLMDIEIKDRRAVPHVIKKLKTSAGLRDRVIVSSFILDDLIRIREELPSTRTISLNRTWPLPFRKKGFWKKLEAAELWAVGFPYAALNPRRVQAIRRRGWQTAAWDMQPFERQSRRVIDLAPDVAIVYCPTYFIHVPCGHGKAVEKISRSSH